MGYPWYQRTNQKIHWNKWKEKYNNPKSMVHTKNSPKRKIHSIKGLHLEPRKISNKTYTLTSKKLGKKKNKDQVSRKRKHRKWVEINKIVLKNYTKDQSDQELFLWKDQWD